MIDTEQNFKSPGFFFVLEVMFSLSLIYTDAHSTINKLCQYCFVCKLQTLYYLIGIEYLAGVFWYSEKVSVYSNG